MKKLINEKVKVTGDIPSPRFGHTFTMVSNKKAVLFGGAVSIAGKFIITNETFLFDFTTSKWTKINFEHDFLPSERAAHSAVAVSDMQMIIYGGAASGNQGLLKDQLYILDLRKQPIWKIIEVSNKNVTPGQRYGHTMLFNKPFLVVFGGNSGNKAENDVWLLNIIKGPFTWSKYEFQNKIMPCPRVYHSAAICEQGSALGMMVVFGGRKQTKKDQKDHNGSQRQLTIVALNDIWGLRKHRDGSWDWVTPPKSYTYTPLSRYQHLVCFMGSMLLIVGGRSNNPDEAVSMIQIYDTEKSEWIKTPSISRYRHAIALYNKNKLFVHGGFQPELASQPLQTMISIDLTPITLLSKTNNNGWIQNNVGLQSKQQPQKTILSQNDNIMNNNIPNTNKPTANNLKTQSRKDIRSDNQNDKNLSRSSRIGSGVSAIAKTTKERDLTPSRIINNTKNIRLSNQVVVAMGDTSSTMQIQRVPVNSLLQESKKLTIAQQDTQLTDVNSIELADSILQVLMVPQQKGLTSSLFPFKKQKVIRLCQQTARIVIKQSSLVGVRPPVKIFGSIYGRYFDLVRLFQNFGFPDEHQMESNEYVFLGNYVDKGFNSLEVICLLMSLKIKYPQHITLLRGKHEDLAINRICGLGEECSIRLGQNIHQLNSVFNTINHLFDCLPLAAAIEDKFLCLHSGIGSIDNLVDINNVVRPVKVRNSPIVTDLLWSGTRDQKTLNYESKTCTEEQIETFLQSNCLEMLINTKDGLQLGVNEQKNTLSVFSVSNHTNSTGKSGILKINKNLSLVPYLLNNSPTKKGSWVCEVQTKSNLNFTNAQLQFRKTLFQN